MPLRGKRGCEYVNGNIIRWGNRNRGVKKTAKRAGLKEIKGLQVQWARVRGFGYPTRI